MPYHRNTVLTYMLFSRTSQVVLENTADKINTGAFGQDNWPLPEIAVHLLPVLVQLKDHLVTEKYKKKISLVCTTLARQNNNQLIFIVIISL